MREWTSVLFCVSYSNTISSSISLSVSGMVILFLVGDLHFFCGVSGLGVLLGCFLAGDLGDGGREAGTGWM